MLISNPRYPDNCQRMLLREQFLSQDPKIIQYCIRKFFVFSYAILTFSVLFAKRILAEFTTVSQYLTSTIVSDRGTGQRSREIMTIREESITILQNEKHDQLHNMFDHLKLAINQLQRDQAVIKETCEQTQEKIHSLLNKLQDDQKKIHNQYDIINKNQSTLIEEQERSLKSLRSRFLRERIKSLLTPKIGRLLQYPAQPLNIPAHYHKKTILPTPVTISIVTPSFNQGDYIEKTIQSVLNQEYPLLEYIVQDGGSTDQSVNTINRYTKNLKSFESKKDNGQTEAINLGFKHATGNIMAYLNSDDLLLPGTLHYVANYFATHPEIDAVYGHRIIIDKDDYEIGRWILPAHSDEVLSWADYIPQETLFWRRSLWDKIGSQLDESFKFAMDWDLLLRFRDAGAKFARLPRFLGAFRVHTHQKTSSAIHDIGIQEMERLIQRCHKRKVSTFEIRRQVKPYQRRHVLLHILYRLGILRY